MGFISKLGNIKNDRKLQKVLLIVLVCLICCMSIAYAAMSTILEIHGTAEVVASNWDIHLDNVSVKSGSSGTTPTITSSTSASFEAVLNTPGDFYEFTIDVVNDGSIDAMIDSVTKTPELTADQARYISYIIEYQNGEPIATKQSVSAGAFVRLKVRVEYRKDISVSDLPTSSTTLNLSFKVNYVQSDGTGTGVTDNGVKKVVNVVSGDGTQVGNEVCIGSECFYVISSTDEEVTMLAKYNLYVGGVYNSGWTAYGEEATGKQDSTMLGYVSGQTVRNGTTAFSSTNYWYSGGLKAEYGTSYPAYVYDSNSSIYNYVENYETYLGTLGVTPSEARLISYEELESLGCSGSSNSCSEAPSWVYSTSYWSGSATDTSNVWSVASYTGFVSYDYGNDGLFGVRPVITISKSEF